ncbi:MAG TPA: PhzF family phenazine biosynthesis protein [Kangiella sp.]
MKSYRIAVFSNAPNTGNQCLVYLANKVLTASEMQSIAASSGLSEVAFIHLQRSRATLRIFSPFCEMLSCLHAALAACYVMQLEGLTVDLYLGGKVLALQHVNDEFAIKVPLLSDEAISQSVNIDIRIQFPDAVSLWSVTTASHKLRLMIEYAYEKQISAIDASLFMDIKSLYPEIESFFTYASTTGSNTYVGRMFAPQLGIDEDPVNGNSCIALASILKKTKTDLTKLKVRQSQQCVVESTVGEDSAFVKATCYVTEITYDDVNSFAFESTKEKIEYEI